MSNEFINFTLIYLICSFNPAILLGLFYNKNISQLGSKNPGATNTFRVLGPLPSLVVFIIDFLKPALAFYLIKSLSTLTSTSILGFPLMAVLGHCYSPMARFKGGKGVATFLGVMTYLNLKWGLVLLLIWALSYLLTKTSWKSSIISCTSSVFVVPATTSIFLIAPILIIFYRHKSNMGLIKTRDIPIAEHHK